MMHRSLAAVLLLLASLNETNLVAQTIPALTVTNKPDSRVEIIPADAGHVSALPVTLAPQIASLPIGSFVLKNRTGKTVTGLAALWTFTDTEGRSRQHKLVTDAYYLPIDWKPIKPFGMLLITPAGYAVEEQFQRLASSGILDPTTGFRISGGKMPDFGELASVKVSVDSVIYEDGAIWGPDALKYYQTLLTRRSALDALSAELNQATGGGEELKAHLKKILNEIPRARDQRGLARRDYADLLDRNPNPNALLKKLEAQGPLPEFHHIEGEAQ